MQTVAPFATVTVSTEMSGECHVPDAFAEDLSVTVASLDFARVWNGHGNYAMTAQELRAAAAAARRLAEECEAFAETAESRA